MPGPIVAVGERVALRTTGREDIAFLARQNNPELRLPTGNPIFTQPGLEDWVEDDFGDTTPLVVCLDDEARPGSPEVDDVQRIGVVAVEDHGRLRPELAYWLIPDYHGDGYGKEAVSLAVDVVFEEYQQPAVEAKTFPENEASCALLESLGFTEEGRLRDYVYWDGEYRDYLVYGLLRAEWSERN